MPFSLLCTASASPCPYDNWGAPSQTTLLYFTVLCCSESEISILYIGHPHVHMIIN